MKLHRDNKKEWTRKDAKTKTPTVKTAGALFFSERTGKITENYAYWPKPRTSSFCR